MYYPCPKPPPWGRPAMLLPLQNRCLAYDLMGPENGPVVCFTHSLAADGGMWAEQVPPLLAAGFRVLRVDMRGHGGSAAVAGDYTMDQLAADTAGGGAEGGAWGPGTRRPVRARETRASRSPPAREAGGRPQAPATSPMSSRPKSSTAS